ncbi:DUF429 domain-containing protein [Nocardioides sp. InS609-2]|uniref:DUF429 domain-containing protein n=1 Tax=Nocardioides sp. InS609-2 TaxID=2760705 RepID=UPI0020BF98E5|nr:DUF429 domain-containing protein [Nocardioides sp. InS609-2]
MYFVGLDLAWGDKKPTGVAVLDGRGHLVHIDAVRTDQEIGASIAPYIAADCLVAIDAPLVVTNPTGNRPAERALNKDFARYDAGAHPSNTGKPEFADVPRGARLSARLGLDIDPDSRGPRRAIEVYPHPAMVALFGLGRTLKYKAKPGRSVVSMRAELLTLTGLLEGLATAEPALHLADQDAWRRLVGDIEAAERKADLRRSEDQVDAVVCAYVALFRQRRLADTTTYGDFKTGYIVTPSLPDGQVPSPRPPRQVEDPVAAAVRTYAARQPALRNAATQATALVTTVLDEAGINYLTVTGRAKSVASFAAKAARVVDGERAFADPVSDITDVIGVRVITYVHSDVEAVAELLGNEAVVLDDRDMGRETASEGRFGYASRHLLIELGPEDAEAAEAHPDLVGQRAQVQIRTVLQHAWAEFEHDIRYKGSIPAVQRAEFDRRFTLAAGLLELADREFSTIRDRLRGDADAVREQARDDDPRIDAQELAAFLAGQYADAGWSRESHYAWISGLLLELGITSLEELAEVVRGVDSADLDRRMGYKSPTGAVRRLDDALLASYADAYVALHGNAHRTDRLRARLDKLTD